MTLYSPRRLFEYRWWFLAFQIGGRPGGLSGLGYTRHLDYPRGAPYLAGRSILAGMDIKSKRIT